MEPAKLLFFKATIISKILSKKYPMNVNATANLIISTVIEIIFTVIWNSCIISMVMRIWKYYLLQKMPQITQKLISSVLFFWLDWKLQAPEQVVSSVGFWTP